MKWFSKALVIGATSAMFSAPMLGYQNFMEVKTLSATGGVAGPGVRSDRSFLNQHLPRS